MKSFVEKWEDKMNIPQDRTIDILTNKHQLFFLAFRKARELYYKHPVESFYDVENIPEKLNIPLFIDYESRLHESSGVTAKIEEKSIICINGDKDIYHQDFTIAHEIFHAVIEDTCEDLTEAEKEIAANHFASLLFFHCNKGNEFRKYCEENQELTHSACYAIDLIFDLCTTRGTAAISQIFIICFIAFIVIINIIGKRKISA